MSGRFCVAARAQATVGEYGKFELTFLLHDPVVTPPVIKFFSFATRSPAQIAALSREVIPQDGFETPSSAVSPDGRWLLYVQADRAESEITLVENFR